MDPRIRKLMREVFETGFVRGALARDEGDLRPGMPPEDVDAALRGASAEWLAELDEQDRAAA
jgi:hypothetical protein